MVEVLIAKGCCVDDDADPREPFRTFSPVNVLVLVTSRVMTFLLENLQFTVDIMFALEKFVLRFRTYMLEERDESVIPPDNRASGQF